jgi:copper resistance protein B
MNRVSATRAAFAFALCLSALASTAFAQDPHAGHQQQKPAPPAKPAAPEPHEHEKPPEQKPELPPFIPPLTDEDRQAAFPDVHGHTVHDETVNYFVLVDQLEWRTGNGTNALSLDTRGWVGTDRDRLWFRAEGDSTGGDFADAQTHLFYGRRVWRWWDAVVGVRQDFRPGAPQTWAAVGVQGLAPYRFDVEVTGYVGAAGRAHVRFEVEYELLFTNRLILQPLFEAEIFAKSDPERHVGAGLSTTELGFRLRYELRREVAPYVGVTWNNRWGQTADLAEAAGQDTGGARFVTGLRLWF